jgi:hypothetical protein
MKLNLGALNNAIEAALAQTNQELAIEAQARIKEKRWDWDRVTRRRSGAIVFTPRDIFDTGALYRSIRLGSGRTSAFIRYKARHASIVHRRRPWLRSTLDEVDVLKLFAKNLRNEL